MATSASGYEVEALIFINSIDSSVSKLEEVNKLTDKKEKKMFLSEIKKTISPLESKFPCLTFIDELAPNSDSEEEEETKTDQSIKKFNQFNDTDKKIIVKFMEYIVKTGEVLNTPDLSYRISCYNKLKALL